jgi:CxxC motif-containing protein
VHREFVCIVCPNSCQLKVEYEGEKLIDINGAQCSKGEAFARNEITNPLRAFTGSVEVTNGNFHLVSVKTPVPIPKKYLKKVGEITHRIKVEAPVTIGQAVAKNLLGEHIDLIATRKVEKSNFYL